jgi:hypothetical protein
MNCIAYMVSYKFCKFCNMSDTLTTYKYGELQVFDATQKLSCKVSCKTPFFLIMVFLVINPFTNDNATLSYATPFLNHKTNYKWPCHLSKMLVGSKVDINYISMRLPFQLDAM